MDENTKKSLLLRSTARIARAAHNITYPGYKRYKSKYRHNDWYCDSTLNYCVYTLVFDVIGSDAVGRFNCMKISK
jgi:hypothetical protein